MLPFHLHGKHRDRRPFKHPGEAEAVDDGGHAAGMPAGVFLAQEDRRQVLDMMKQQWEQYNSEYQKLTLSLHNLHTIERVKRREQLENQITTLERSIKNLEKPFVFLQVGGVGGGLQMKWHALREGGGCECLRVGDGLPVRVVCVTLLYGWCV